MRLMVAAVASEEPHTAAKPAHAPIVAMASAPRKPLNRDFVALKSLADMPNSDATAPIRMNSGTTDSA